MKGSKPLVVFGCVHVGSKHADLEMAHRYVEFVKETNGYALLISDNFENAIPKKGHQMFEQDRDPDAQMDYAVDLYRPITKNIVGVCSGNHANRTREEAGIDMDYRMVKELGIVSKYHQNQGFVGLKVGKQLYKIAYTHGGGVGSNVFGNCTKLMRDFPSADICCASHTHRLAYTTDHFWDTDNNGKRTPHEVTLINTGSLLNYPRYADAARYRPQKKGFAIVWLGEKDRSIVVDISGRI